MRLVPSATHTPTLPSKLRGTGALALCCGLAAALAMRAQSPADGLHLIAPLGSTDSHLVDNAGAIVHTWPGAGRPNHGLYLADDGAIFRTRLPADVDRIEFDGSVTWSFSYNSGGNLAHHDIALLPNGNILMIAWEFATTAEAIAAGRDPASFGAAQSFRPDHIIEVEPSGSTGGNIVWEWHVMDHIIQDFDATQANYGVVADHPELLDINFPPTPLVASGEFNHCNSVFYEPIHDWVVISSAFQNEIWVIDHSTTTAEAAGHSGGRWGKGGDFLYRWGNPVAYRAGTSADQALFFQHNARVIPPGRPGAGNITIFNNKFGAPGPSEVLEIVLPLGAQGNFQRAPGSRYGPATPVWSYSDPMIDSSFRSSAERLPNGHTLICSSTPARLFEITPTGQVVFTYRASSRMFHSHFVERSVWSDVSEISIAAGGTAQIELVAGSAHAGQRYLLLGSASGTTPGFTAAGVHIPLQADGYLTMTASRPSIFPLGTSIGTADSLGRATSSFTLPARVLPPAAAGIQFDHTFVLFDSAGTGDPVFAGNAVPLRLVR